MSFAHDFSHIGENQAQSEVTCPKGHGRAVAELEMGPQSLCHSPVCWRQCHHTPFRCSPWCWVYPYGPTL